MSKHLTTARTKGAKAGFNQFIAYLESPLGSNNDKVAEIRDLILSAGNRKAQFDAYCGAFLSGNTPVRSTPVRTTKPSRTTRIAKAVEILDTPKPKAAKDDKERTWNAYWVERKGLPTTVGSRFSYKSKKYGTTSIHKVVRSLKDGGIVTIRESLSK